MGPSGQVKVLESLPHNNAAAEDAPEAPISTGANCCFNFQMCTVSGLMEIVVPKWCSYRYIQSGKRLQMFLATNHQRKYLKAKLLPQVLENNIVRLAMVDRNPLCVYWSKKLISQILHIYESHQIELSHRASELPYNLSTIMQMASLAAERRLRKRRAVGRRLTCASKFA